MRGTHDNYEVSIYKHGIIPAYAGNTWVCHTSSLHIGDHPRVCGEHIGVIPKIIIDCVGIIPAYAGNTPCL